MCHVNSNDNTAPAPAPAPCRCLCRRRSIISRGSWQNPCFTGIRAPACLPQPQIMKTRLVREIAHLHFLLIFSFQRKNERRWGRRRRGGGRGRTAAFPGPVSSVPGAVTETVWGRGEAGRGKTPPPFLAPVTEPLRQRKLPGRVRPRGQNLDPWRGPGAGVPSSIHSEQVKGNGKPFLHL